ncbi:MAG TPA: acyl-CoA dehydrogenase family protein, partial [Candidatus Thalassarchaeaceae archaeon]|nr:acyl-CoA dehydrogenase family protein [Candidatus Thalassarchaeaceae archaeon]
MAHTTVSFRGVMGEGWRDLDIANPTDEHAMLRQMVRDFVREEVEPQALEHDRDER